MKGAVNVLSKELDTHIEKIIGNRVKEIIDQRLGDIVAGEFAKMSLSGKEAPDISFIARKQIDNAVRTHLQKRNVDYLVRNAVERSVDQIVQKTVDTQLCPVLKKVQNQFHNSMNDAIAQAFGDQ